MECFRWCKVSLGLQETIQTPLGLAFQVSERLSSVLDPSGRDVFVGNTQVLKGIGIDFLGDIAMKVESIFGIGVAILILRRISMTKS